MRMVTRRLFYHKSVLSVMEMSDVVIADVATLIVVEDAVPSFSATIHETFVSKSLLLNYIHWKLYLMRILMFWTPRATKVPFGDTMMLCVPPNTIPS
jgi:hypothetical protein